MGKVVQIGKDSQNSIITHYSLLSFICAHAFSTLSLSIVADFILALDQGTTSSRAIIFDRGGRIHSIVQKEFPQIFPQPGWVEHDPGQIWNTQIEVARDALAKSKLTPKDIAALGITNQRETTVIWDRKTGAP